MTKYLDQNGLSYFWTKIKAWMASHAPVKYFGQNWVVDSDGDYALVVGDGADSDNLANVLVIENGGVVAKIVNEIDSTVTPVSPQYPNAFTVHDALDDLRLVIGMHDWTDGKQGVEFKTARNINGSDKYHGVTMLIDDQGEKSVYFDADDGKHAWQEALNNWKPPFGIKDQDANFTKADNDVSGAAYDCIYFRDSANNKGVSVEQIIGDTGRVGFGLYARNYDTQGALQGTKGLKYLMDKLGAGSWTVSDAADFRRAIGLGQSGSGNLPLTIAQGGSGATSVAVETTMANIIQAASGITITGGFAVTWGPMVACRINYKRSTAISVPADGNCTDFDVGTLKEAYRPRKQVIGISHADSPTYSGLYAVHDTGRIECTGFEGSGTARSIAANEQLMFWFIAIK